MHIFYGLFLVVCVTSRLDAMSGLSEERFVEHPIRGVLIFLDDAEYGILGAVSEAFASAIIQEAGPLIVSASLLANIRGDLVPQPMKNPENIKREMEKLERGQEVNSSVILATRVFNATAPLASSWVIKEINPSLYLLLPKKYMARSGISLDEVEKCDMAGSITPTEYKLGLKINHMTTKILQDVIKPSPACRYADYFIHSLGIIFVTRSEYVDKDLIPYWCIYITGHGSVGAKIVGLRVKQFKAFLSFLETVISTRLLIYSSCYAAGVNTNLVYDDAERGVTQTSSFPIVVGSLVDMKVSKSTKTVLENERLEFGTGDNFAEFFNRMTRPDVIAYQNLMVPIRDSATGLPKIFDVINMPQIKLPGLPWFSVIDANERAVSIGSIMAKSRTEPLKIQNFFKKGGKKAEPHAILLYAADVPFEIDLGEMEDVPLIVSMIPGDAVHHIKKISSSEVLTSVSDILKNCFDIKMSGGPCKVFIIDEIVGSNSTGTNAIAQLSCEGNELYYYDNRLKQAVRVRSNFKVNVFDNEKQYKELLEKYGSKEQVMGVEKVEGIETRPTQELLTPGAMSTIRGSVSKKRARQTTAVSHE